MFVQFSFFLLLFSSSLLSCILSFFLSFLAAFFEVCLFLELFFGRCHFAGGCVIGNDLSDDDF